MFNDVRPFTLTSKSMAFALYQAVNYIVANDISGAIVECGVAGGGSMMLAATTLLARDRRDRDLFLFDTFDWSFENPTYHDGFAGTPDRLARTPGSNTQPQGVGVNDVAARMATTGYPTRQIRLVRGMVQDTLAVTDTGDVAILRLDTDFYESTLCELETLYPRLVPGGVLILDDYGKLKGATAAADEYFAHCQDPPLLHRIETQGRIATKPTPRAPAT
ncbi:Demethyldecarbamoylnovobiocin O-methyltransferase [Mycobacterium simulans]|uniref:Demethyldecarbamoylnovobiocin O-methyltransferase n=2 Tax=Mycobacterium simulans TaxID=627089 RepID=A0A7Z7IP34_9MYCO|nr:TylF/MycF family methyltransferase [Mycobacterium simulans]SOJ56716.1 Demethyldecarbamoylnovobiocin O-methyltransferase [Mycobacterium simulans]